MNRVFALFDHARRPLFWKSLSEMNSSRLSYREIVPDRLKALLLHAVENVPFYRELVVSKDAIENDPVRALKEFPIIEKETLMKDQKAFCIDPLPADAYENSTGGSTGTPLQVIQDKWYSQNSLAGKYLFYTWAGWMPGAKILKIWGSPRDVLQQEENVKGKVSSMLYKIKVLDAFRISTDDAKNYLREYEAYKPDILECYVDAAYTLALYVKQTGMTVKHKPRGVIVSAGTLYPEFEKIIKEVFQAPVINRYGSREAGDIACTCPEGAIHVNPFTHFVEIVDNNGNPIEDGTGHVVLTLLTNYTMPLIRYKIGDMATVKKNNPPCPCGRDWQTLESVDGRSGSVFRKRDGSVVSPLFFVHFFGVVHNKGFISKYQAIQEDYDHIVLKVRLRQGFDADNMEVKQGMEQLKKDIKHVMGEDVRVEVRFVEDIPPLPSGKYVYAISKVDGN